MSMKRLPRRTAVAVSAEAGLASRTEIVAGGLDIHVFLAPMDKIRPNPDQPRKIFDDEKIRALAVSIEDQGLKQPILIQADGEEGYIIAAGERRFRAFQILGRTRIPAIKTTGELDEIALLENLQREELSAVEVARALDRLSRDHSYTQDALSSITGLSRSEVARLLLLAAVDPAILDEYVTLEDPPTKSAMYEIAMAPEEKRQSLWEHAKEGTPVLALRQLRETPASQNPEPPENQGATSPERVPLPESLKVRRSLTSIGRQIKSLAGRRESLRQTDIENLRSLRAEIDALLSDLSPDNE